MKKLIAIIAIILTAVTGYSQAPDSLQYSMTVQTGTYSIEITQGDLSPVFSLTGIVATSDTTLHLKLGISDTISWLNGPYHLRVYDGTMTEIGYTQLVSVPYAKYATRSGHATTADTSSHATTSSGVSVSYYTIAQAEADGILISDGNLPTTWSYSDMIISTGRWPSMSVISVGYYSISNTNPGDYVYLLLGTGWIKVTF